VKGAKAGDAIYILLDQLRNVVVVFLGLMYSTYSRLKAQKISSVTAATEAAVEEAEVSANSAVSIV
jgi:hypothetical protein